DVEMRGVGEDAGSGRRSRREEACDLSSGRLTRGPLLVGGLGRVVAALESAAVFARAGDAGAGPCHVDLERRLKAGPAAAREVCDSSAASDGSPERALVLSPQQRVQCGALQGRADLELTWVAQDETERTASVRPDDVEVD